MQSFSDANLRCCECQEKFSSASALLHHFARHALAAEREKPGNENREGNSRYDWQPWRCDDIFKTKRKGHNFLETALLSINETCRKRAKLQAAATTPVSTSSENSSQSLTGKSETSETETKGAEHSQDGIVQENQSLTNNFECCSKNPSKYTTYKLKRITNSYDEELVENPAGEDRSSLVQIIKLEETTSINNNNKCIVKYPGPEPIITPESPTNLVLPLELSASETCFNRTNDDCDVYNDDDDNNICKLGNSLDKVNCDNNNIIYYNDNSLDKLPKSLEVGGNLDNGLQVDDGKVLRDFSVEERKRKLSNRKQTTPKKIERNENGFLKIAPRPENLPRDERQIANKKGSKKKYFCPLCSRVFGWSTDLKRHILVHTGERPFKCNNCSSSFTRKFLLQKHQTKMHPLNGKTERERLLELKVSENLKQLKSKMLELQKTKMLGNKNSTHFEPETENLEETDSDKGHEEIIEEIDIKVEPPNESFFKTEDDSDENWDSTSNNNNNNNNVDGEFGSKKSCINENIVFVEPIIMQSS